MADWMEAYDDAIQERIQWIRAHQDETTAQVQQAMQALADKGRAMGDPVLTGYALSSQGTWLYNQGKLNEATEQLLKAFGLLDSADCPKVMFRTCTMLGAVHLQQEAMETAMDWFMRAKHVAAANDLQEYLLMTEFNIANLYASISDSEQSRLTGLEMSRHIEQMPQTDFVKRMKILNQTALSNDHVQLGMLKEARSYLDALEEMLAESPGDEQVKITKEVMWLSYYLRTGEEEQQRACIEKLRQFWLRGDFEGQHQYFVFTIANGIGEIYRQKNFALLREAQDILEALLKDELSLSTRLELLDIKWRMLEDKTTPEAVTLVEEILDVSEQQVREDHKTKRSTLQTIVTRYEQMSRVDNWIEQATHDALTGLWNRRGMENNVLPKWREKAARTDRKLMVAILDIDHFKEYNDRLGHMAGDECLKQMASLFRRHGGEDVDFVRQGGDEFVALGIAKDESEVQQKFQKLLAELAAMRIPHPANDGGWVSLSAGAVLTDDREVSLKTLMEQADQTLYRVKQHHRGGFRMKDEP